MKIAVCVKQVPDAARRKRLDPQTKRLDRSGEGAINPFDVHAVEEALRIKEGGEGGEVVLVSLGPAKAAESLRKALAMGADRAVLVTDDGGRGLRPGRHERRRSQPRSSARAPTSCCSASRRATRTAPCSGRPSPSGCAGR